MVAQHAASQENSSTEMSLLVEKSHDHVKSSFATVFGGTHRGDREEQTLTWHQLSYSVRVKKAEKHILKGVSGSVKGGDLVAIMGPSGSGKSTLLNALSSRISSGGKCKLSGSVALNGVPTKSFAFREKLAYVMQDDALYATATPREALTFSSRLRLPSTVSFAAQDERVEGLINALNLAKCANTVIGSLLIKGISGGERKRTAIGVELITNPDLLFCDEPTSGLDSHSAFNVIQILTYLAQTGCAVLCTIHQPSSEVFSLFNKIILIDDGRILYQGPRQDMVSYFSKVHNSLCPEFFNPADHVMFLMQTVKEDVLYAQQKQYFEEHEEVAKEQKGGGGGGGGGGVLGNEEEILAGLAPTTVVAVAKAVASSSSLVKIHHRNKASCCTQLSYLMMRELRRLDRDKMAVKASFGITIFLNLLYSLIFLSVGRNDDLFSHFGGLIQLTISAQFGASQPMILTFPLERPIFLREYATGTYGSVPYFVSKMLVEVPVEFVRTVLVYLVAYWLMGLDGNFLELVLPTWLLSVVASSTALLLGCIATNVSTAMQAAPAIFVPQLLFAGFFIKIELIPAALRWLQYLCALKFAVNLTMIAEFGDAYDSSNDVNRTIAVKELFSQNEVDKDLWYVNYAVLIGLFIFFRLMALFFLRAKASKFD